MKRTVIALILAVLAAMMLISCLGYNEAEAAVMPSPSPVYVYEYVRGVHILREVCNGENWLN